MATIKRLIELEQSLMTIQSQFNEMCRIKDAWKEKATIYRDQVELEKTQLNEIIKEKDREIERLQFVVEEMVSAKYKATKD